MVDQKVSEYNDITIAFMLNKTIETIIEVLLDCRVIMGIVLVLLENGLNFLGTNSTPLNPTWRRHKTHYIQNTHMQWF